MLESPKPETRQEKMEGYLAAVLDEESKALLRAQFPPKHSQEFYHHMTIAFRPSKEQYEKYAGNLDGELELNIVGYAEDDRGQAVIVETPLSENSDPHITLSCAKGTSPVYSNELIKNAKAAGTVKPVNLKIRAKVKFASFKK
ncbi:MAG: hypothetical protein A3H69_03020 [Candidatus Sungbacteria bacterium RIFCSPLOWO2_02_FULL_47_9]|uniref:tRNA ligase phosphodiesterase domain-containing protein n=1 Tax=Candidatus Sungbacteria bacterium RIFCSPHIGHO2_01_FULL_47_32 TaxID=1802264 RepID=A0A1G2K606_9BACT|nr:MAG: hypothetical protein UX72_C0042G0002 [Parcubacteria group bacterium GW2011_GWA2_47_10]OGZ94857.1 MAG: hypothetical protein A2633_00045 [Candidatus Sungbacteria bacterium RIFCSPHIGHO2_01_FULL_47_32]OGZ99030.1 MAG: hypothetical protein A3D57_04855 [Candidatus Sungbacteria bacterium RIFCSPHIGHO2_02_FULL_46_12]OHA10586.1 MAG: hypothetical protein A3H69_03020 [Candidatus Sungbacteria bacterium RIFCSPLOWO2_02_FULL_47_9]